jgi:hypothetical protein
MKNASCTKLLSTMPVFLFSIFTVFAQALDVSGKWNMNVETNGIKRTPVFMLKQTGETITGSYSGQFGEAPVTGALNKNAIKLEFKAGGYNVLYTGTVEGNTMKGKVAVSDVAEGVFTGTKETK